MSFSNSELNNFLSRTKDKISSFISNALYSPINPFYKYNSTLATNKNQNKSYSIDLYRSDYIPFKKKLYNSTINSEKDIYSRLRQNMKYFSAFLNSNTGILYFGIDISVDKDRGLYWLHKSADHKNEMAVKALSDINYSSTD